MKRVAPRKGFLASSVCAALVSTTLLPQLANAHGYLQDPPSRDILCKQKQNTGCDSVDWPPSAGEFAQGFPSDGPADGKLIGGHIFPVLDEQSANRWHRVPLDKHEIEFKWLYTAAHVTKRWEYFITRRDWNPNAALERASFESTPFCSVDGGGKKADDPSHPKHTCAIPADRLGHHIILGVWTVGDTSNAFYKAVDVDIQVDGGPAPEWRQVGSINPHRNLKKGDKVKARAFVGGHESEQFSASIVIETAEEGGAPNWAYKLAKQINATQVLVSAGQKDAEGNVAPVRGSNIIFAKQESGVTGYELGFEGSPPDAYMHLHGVKPQYSLIDGKATIDFSVMTNRSMEVTAILFDASNKQVGYQRQPVDSTTKPFTVDAISVEGEHVLKVVGKNEDDEILLQQERDLTLEAQGEEVYPTFPEGIAGYTAGTRVYARGTRDVYECKPFPYSGYCRQWTESTTQYEPGIGSQWQSAWDRH